MLQIIVIKAIEVRPHNNRVMQLTAPYKRMVIEKNDSPCTEALKCEMGRRRGKGETIRKD